MIVYLFYFQLYQSQGKAYLISASEDRTVNIYNVKVGPCSDTYSIHVHISVFSDIYCVPMGS